MDQNQKQVKSKNFSAEGIRELAQIAIHSIHEKLKELGKPLPAKKSKGRKKSQAAQEETEDDDAAVIGDDEEEEEEEEEEEDEGEEEEEEEQIIAMDSDYDDYPEQSISILDDC